MGEKTRVHIFVEGRVQRVCFRANIKKKAQAFGFSGWTRNLEDGRVEVMLEGEKEKIAKMIKWLKNGHFIAKVNNIEVKFEKFKGDLSDFEIKFD